MKLNFHPYYSFSEFRRFENSFGAFGRQTFKPVAVSKPRSARKRKKSKRP